MRVRIAYAGGRLKLGPETDIDVDAARVDARATLAVKRGGGEADQNVEEKNMRHLLVLALCLVVPGLVLAQQHDWDRAHRVIAKAQEDLRRIEHREGWAEGDRGHYEAAERNLADVRKDLDSNRLDRARLESTITEIEHISRVDRIDAHAREILSEDVRELRRLRDEWHWR